MNARKIELAHPPYVANSRTRLVYCNGIFVGTVSNRYGLLGWCADDGNYDDGKARLFETPEEAAEALAQSVTAGGAR